MTWKKFKSVDTSRWKGHLITNKKFSCEKNKGNSATLSLLTIYRSIVRDY